MNGDPLLRPEQVATPIHENRVVLFHYVYVLFIFVISCLSNLSSCHSYVKINHQSGMNLGSLDYIHEMKPTSSL